MPDDFSYKAFEKAVTRPRALAKRARLPHHQAVQIVCPHCGGAAIGNYKNNPKFGKCSAASCHKVFGVSKARLNAGGRNEQIS